MAPTAFVSSSPFVSISTTAPIEAVKSKTLRMLRASASFPPHFKRMVERKVRAMRTSLAAGCRCKPSFQGTRTRHCFIGRFDMRKTIPFIFVLASGLSKKRVIALTLIAALIDGANRFKGARKWAAFRRTGVTGSSANTRTIAETAGGGLPSGPGVGELSPPTFALLLLASGRGTIGRVLRSQTSGNLSLHTVRREPDQTTILGKLD
jgi:hypothetical protein